MVGLIGGIGWYVWSQNKDKPAQQQSITNFEQCAAAGNPVMESFPEQCSANGQTFTNEAQDNDTFVDGLATYRNASQFDDRLRSEIKNKITDPLIYYENKVMRTPDFKGVVIDLGLEDDNITRNRDNGYILPYVYNDPELDGIGFVFGDNGEINYWLPQLCDPGDCLPYPEDFKQAFPETYKAYQRSESGIKD